MCPFCSWGVNGCRWGRPLQVPLCCRSWHGTQDSGSLKAERLLRKARGKGGPQDPAGRVGWTRKGSSLTGSAGGRAGEVAAVGAAQTHVDCASCSRVGRRRKLLVAFGCTGRERGCGVSTSDVCCSHTLGRGRQSSEPDQPAADLRGWAVTSVHCNCIRLPQAPDSPSQGCLQFPRQFQFFCSEQILCPFSAEVVRLWQPQLSFLLLPTWEGLSVHILHLLKARTKYTSLRVSVS